jgi:HSP20 family molecular chaperone IbpA
VGHARRDSHHRVGRRPHPRRHITGKRARHIALPVTADANDIKATYHRGILEISIGLHDADEDTAGRRIPVQTALLDGHPARARSP